MENWAFITLIVLAALAAWYGLLLTHRPISALRSVVKVAATAGIVVIAMSVDTPLLIVVGLICGVVGDFFLSRDEKTGFLPGLAAFLIGHVLYAIWITYIGVSGLFVVSLSMLVSSALVVLIAALLWGRLRLVLGPLRVPVAAYCTVSCILCILAFGLLSHSVAIVLIAGVTAFVLSDVILAIHLFLLPNTSSWRAPLAMILWGFYWLGQVAIAVGSSHVLHS